MYLKAILDLFLNRYTIEESYGKDVTSKYPEANQERPTGTNYQKYKRREAPSHGIPS